MSINQVFGDPNSNQYTASWNIQSAMSSFTPASTAQTVTTFNPRLNHIVAPPFAASDGKTVVVIVPMSALADMSDTDVWRCLETDLAISADEILVQREPGQYRVIQNRNDYEEIGLEILGEDQLWQQLMDLRKRLVGEVGD